MRNIDAAVDQLIDAIKPESEIVGIGEAAHGVSEVQAISYKLALRLKNDMGFNCSIFEGDYLDFLMLSNSLNDETGSSILSLSNFNEWFHKSTHLLNYVKELQNVQAISGMPHKLIGLDFQSPQRYAESIIRDIQHKYPSIYEISLSLYSIVLVMDEHIDDYDKAIDNSVSMLTIIKETCPETDSARVFWITLAKRIIQCLHFRKIRSFNFKLGIEIRDLYMFKNFVEEISQNKDLKPIIHAHQLHISKKPPINVNFSTSTLGEGIYEKYGQKYFTILLTFSNGKIIGVSPTSSQIEEFKISKSEKMKWQKSLNSVYRNSDLPKGELCIWQFGSIIEERYKNDYIALYNVSECFDLVYVRESVSPFVPLKRR